MQNKIIIAQTPLPLVIPVLAAAILLAGCTGMQIKEDRRIALIPGSDQRGTDQTSTYTMKYLYRYDQSDPDGSGTVQLKANIGIRAKLKGLTISVNWLDDDGKVLESKAFWYSGFKKRYSGWNID